VIVVKDLTEQKESDGGIQKTERPNLEIFENRKKRKTAMGTGGGNADFRRMGKRRQAGSKN